MALYAYLAIIVILFAFIAIIYNSLDYALDTSEDEFKAMINDSSDAIATYSLSTRSTIRDVWTYFPIFMFILLLIWAIVAVQREDRWQ